MKSGLLARAAGAVVGTGVTLPDRVLDLHQQARTLAQIRRLGINLVLDVGANRGFYSRRLRMAGYDGLIFAFEPEPEAYKALCERAEGDAAWKCFNFALGEKAGSLAFNVIHSGSETVLSSFLAPKLSEEATTTTVEVRRLADVLAEHLPPDPRIFLKMDTQGYDLHVFRGAGDLGNVHLLQSEVSVIPIYEGMPHYTESLLEYEQAGFSIIDLFVVSRNAGGKILEFDALMCR